MFGDKFKRKYALSDQGAANIKKGTVWTVIVNLIVMSGIGILYLLMLRFIETLTQGRDLPGAALFALLLAAFVILSLVTHLQQYRATYGLVYGEVKSMRLGLAERLRKLPLAYFGKRDLADLTETLMGDVSRMEHVWSHVLGYLYGAYISTAIIAIGLFIFDWRLAIASLWGVPAAFALLFGSRKIAARNAETSKAASLVVSDGIQEVIENIREIRASNQQERFLNDLYKKIDDHETAVRHGELTTGLFINAASVIMRLNVATTVLAGAKLIVSGDIDFMLLFTILFHNASSVECYEVFAKSEIFRRRATWMSHLYEDFPDFYNYIEKSSALASAGQGIDEPGRGRGRLTHPARGRPSCLLPWRQAERALAGDFCVAAGAGNLCGMKHGVFPGFIPGRTCCSMRAGQTLATVALDLQTVGLEAIECVDVCQ